MTIQIGNFNIPLVLIACIIPLILLSITASIVIKGKTQKKLIINNIINILFLIFISWKLTPLFTSFKTVIANPSTFLFLTGGRTGEIVSLVISTMYVIFLILRHKNNRSFISFISIYLALTIITFISILNINSNKIDSKEVINISKLTLKNMENELTNINLKSEKIIILNFWASWCPPCKAEIPELINFYNDYESEIDFYGINLINTEKGDISDFLVTNNMNFPIYLDTNNQVSNYFDVKTIPTTLIIFKKDGELYMEKHSGVITYELLKRFMPK